jgi:tellurite resistance protein
MVKMMNLTKLNSALGSVKKPQEIEQVSLRYVDTMGNMQTVEIAEVIEEIPHGDEGSRRVILVAQK